MVSVVSNALFGINNHISFLQISRGGSYAVAVLGDVLLGIFICYDEVSVNVGNEEKRHSRD